MSFEFLAIPVKALENIHILWTFFLLMMRFSAMLVTMPGIGMGVKGLVVRGPAILVLSFCSMTTSPVAPLPDSWGVVVLSMVSEVLLGSILGFIPLLTIAGFQMAGHLASTVMGLQASQLIDPTMQIAVPDLSRIYGDLVIIIFLFIGGHHVMVHAAAGLGGHIMPGSFVLGGETMSLLIDKTGHVFRLGVMVSGPIIAALLLTNFVLGLITKAVPTVNIFIVSFPLTIGIGLILAMLIVPEIVHLGIRELRGIEPSVNAVMQDVHLTGP